MNCQTLKTEKLLSSPSRKSALISVDFQSTVEKRAQTQQILGKWRWRSSLDVLLTDNPGLKTEIVARALLSEP